MAILVANQHLCLSAIAWNSVLFQTQPGAAIAGTLAPVVLFIWLAPIFLFAGIREAYANGDRCGMPAMGALLGLFVGTTIQLVLGLFVQAALSARRRHRPRD